MTPSSGQRILSNDEESLGSTLVEEDDQDRHTLREGEDSPRDMIAAWPPTRRTVAVALLAFAMLIVITVILRPPEKNMDRAATRPDRAAAAIAVAAEEVPEESYWMDKCAWSGDEDCSEKKCCNNQGYQCFKKNEYYSGCQESAPEGWDGTVLGGFRAWEVAKAADGKCQGSTLWCITIVSTSEEQALLDAQQENGVGIFECDAHSVFKGAPAPVGEWKSIANTDVFIDVWEKQIKVDPTWDKYDWTVKVDIDLVFFPGRLKQHIEALCAPKDTSLFLKNIDFKWGFMGSLEVFSHEAMRVYSKVGYKCSDHLGHNSGEDGYMKACMDAIGAGYMVDFGLLDDKYTRGGFSGWGNGDCASSTVVGFHPFKTEWVWESCHDAARRSAQESFKCLALGCDNAR